MGKLPYPYDTKRCKYPYYSLTNQLKPELPNGKSLLNIPENPYEPWHYMKVDGESVEIDASLYPPC